MNTICGHVETPRRGVSTTSQVSHMARSQWRSGCLGAIINQFKSVYTKQIRGNINLDFAWQPRYHDRIIRSQDEYNRISEYILNNPENWEQDDNFA
jgi:putative transposase